jgi:hypothetical protein
MRLRLFRGKKDEDIPFLFLLRLTSEGNSSQNQTQSANFLKALRGRVIIFF